MPRQLLVSSRISSRGDSAQLFAIAQHQRTERGTAQGMGLFQDCVENRHEVPWRRIDDLKHVAGRGLVFERFLEVVRALAQFAKQPRVFHRDDRLRGEILQERYLFVGECPRLLAIGD